MRWIYLINAASMVTAIAISAQVLYATVDDTSVIHCKPTIVYSLANSRRL